MSWQQLLDIVRQQRAELEDEKTRVPVDCPNDGTPLKTGPHGELYCPHDGWQPGR